MALSMPNEGRGMVTPLVTQTAKRLLNIDDIETDELRLMPYVQYVMMNEQKINPAKINSEDRKILSRWKQMGWIEGGIFGLAITKEFWTAINEILWIAYVGYREYAEVE